jgi:hypothetical protein
MPVIDDPAPPDWDNPPCPACFAFDVEAGAPASTTPEELTQHLRTAYAAGMTEGYLRCRMRSGGWQRMCPDHRAAAQAVIDCLCAQLKLPRDRVYADIGLPMPEAQAAS